MKGCLLTQIKQTELAVQKRLWSGEFQKMWKISFSQVIEEILEKVKRKKEKITVCYSTLFNLIFSIREKEWKYLKE